MRLLTSLVALTSAAALCFLMAPCASVKEHITEKQDKITTVHQAKFLMGRKLKSFGDQDFIITHKKLMQQVLSPGEKKQENVMPDTAGKGTWKEWVDEEGLGPNKSEFYFTMDYRWVRRRSPIHNKQLPFTP